MLRNPKSVFVYGITALFSFFWSNRLVQAQVIKNQHVMIVGAMKQVMRQGNLTNNINLDTISKKENLYGLGPLANLKGEILVLNGIAYRAVLTNQNTIQVDSTFEMEAPFFGYARINKWTTLPLPRKITNLKKLEAYLNKKVDKNAEPFFFKIIGNIQDGTIHVVNLPSGTIIKSPTDAHQGMVKFTITKQDVIILGFFSHSHHSIFTHHDTKMHLHLITADSKIMGHLEHVSFRKKGTMLYLPD